jgi:hypothetical protein
MQRRGVVGARGKVACMTTSGVAASTAMRSSTPRKLLVWSALLGGVVLAVLQASPFDDLRTLPTIALIASAAALGLVLQGLATLVGDYTSRDQRTAELDSALAIWPPPAVCEASPFDLGVRPEARAGSQPLRQYRARPEDRELDAALEEADIVLVIGPPGVGKSRSAAEALRRLDSEATLIVPEDAAGLTRALSGASDLLSVPRDGTRRRHVLWLDDLERFVDALHLNALDEFQRADDDSALQGARARMANLVTDSRSRCGVQIVATVRDDTLREILAGGGEAANVTRRFVARARRVHLPSRRPPFPDLSCGASQPLFRPTRLGALPAALGERPPSPAALNVGLGLTIALAGAFAAMALIGVVVRPGAPPALAEQIAGIRDIDDPCGGVETSPRTADSMDRVNSLVAVTHRTDGCTSSDAARFYELKAGRLEPVGRAISLGLSAPTQRIVCLGSEAPDPCHAEISGGRHMVVIGLRSVATGHVLPAVVWRERRQLHVASLGLPPPADLRVDSGTDDLRRARAVDLEPVTLALTRAGPQEDCGPPSCLRGYTAASLAILSPSGDSSTATLLAGYVQSGSIDAPRRLAVRAFAFIFVGPRPQVGPSCTIQRAGKSVAVSVALTPGRSTSAAMRRAWVRTRATATAVICRPGASWAHAVAR